ncbi:MAG: TonB-dependent receptor domain-containing protein [Longimicrobiaceae bacterium]
MYVSPALLLCGRVWRLRLATLFAASLVAWSFSSDGLAAQSAPESTGQITGRVVSSADAGPVNSATLQVEGLGIGGLSDLDGRYRLGGVPPGTHTLVVQRLGYATKRITGVAVAQGEIEELDVVLESEVVALEGVTVTAERARGSASALLNRRRTADAVLDAVGSAEISRTTAGNAADVAKRMTGVTVTGGRYVYVRGLGERYSQTSLNGSPLPSPEPEREVVPLDLFPAGFLESITAQKTYTPDLPGDFSGANVAIETKEFPAQLSLSVGVGTSFNSESQFRQNFLTYDGGSLDFLGIDDGTRALPEMVEEVLGKDGRVPDDPALRERLGQEFPLNFTPYPVTTPLNRSFDFSLGTRVTLFGKDLGFLLAATYSDDYSRREEIERKHRSSSFNPEIPDERRVPDVDYLFNTSNRRVDWGGIGNFTLLLSPRSKLSLKTAYNRSSDDEARVFTGANREDLGADIRSDRLRFVARSLAWAQLSGEHVTPLLDSRLEWRLTGARATRDEPALRQAVYLRGFNQPEETPRYLHSFNESGRYFYSDLGDNDFSARADWEVPLPWWGGRGGSVKAGAMWRLRERDFNARRFHWEFDNGVVADDIESALDDGAIVGSNDREPGEFVLDDVFEPGDRYGVLDRRGAGYVMVEIPLTRGLRAIGGARVERYSLELSSRDSLFADVENSDVLPALNLVYALTPRMNLRAAASQTLDRPEFRELAPFGFTEATSLRKLSGNPSLKVARLRSGDLRWEWFPRPNELLSVSAFYKELKNPIEQVLIATASSAAYSYQNAENGRIFGVEFDARLGLGSISPRLAPLTAQVNAALVDSEVNVVEKGTFIPTNPVRPLEGQAPYVVNASLLYARGGGIETGLFYNLTGKRLAAAGGNGLPDIDQRSRHQLDATFRAPLAGGITLKLKGSNLLGAEHVWEQSQNGITLLQRRYQPGRSFSLGLSADL